MTLQEFIEQTMAIEGGVITIANRGGLRVRREVLDADGAVIESDEIRRGPQLDTTGKVSANPVPISIENQLRMAVEGLEAARAHRAKRRANADIAEASDDCDDE